MNTNHLKRFAQEARRKLLEQVGAKLSFVLTTDSVELREKTGQLKQLRQELGRIPKEQLIEKVAYTWFNRLVALRFMDANDYQPLGIRIITPKDGYTIPEILDEAKRGNIPDELKVNRQKIFDLLDNNIPSTNPQNEAFKELLIAACNYLNTTLPFLFEKINDFTELLLPDDLSSDFSIVKDMEKGMLMDDCINVEIIGWLYQFYISEENERLISEKKPYKKHELAPASQLFTPKWIVQYMVDNTLGQLLTEIYPNTNITKNLEFYIQPSYIEQLQPRSRKKVEEIKFFDPCVGSAHILSYAFDVFYMTYKEQGYNEVEIPELILSNNLYGTDIDERATQLSSFVLMMKARQYNRRFLKRTVEPNISCFKDYEFDNKFKNASSIGSLINIEPHDVEKIVVEKGSIFEGRQRELKQLYVLLGQLYDVVVTNPPYISSSKMEGTLKQYVEEKYQETKSDLFATFITRCVELCNDGGLSGYMSPFVWMFISRYEKLRRNIIDKHFVNNLIQLEYSGFEGATVPICTFTLRKKKIPNAKGSYIRLSDFKGARVQAPKTLEAINNPDCDYFYLANQDDFNKISGSPFGYFAYESFVKRIDSFEELGDFGYPRKGMVTANNPRFIRFWYEVEYSNIGYGYKSREIAKSSRKKWFPYQKGGGFRRWYGNLNSIVNWKDDGKELLGLKDEGYKVGSTNHNLEFIFKPALVWNKVTSSFMSFRYSDSGYLFDDASGLCPVNEDIEILCLLGILNTPTIQHILQIINPTLNLQSGDIARIPVSRSLLNDKKLKELVIKCLDLCKDELSDDETSWHFNRWNLFNYDTRKTSLEESFDYYKALILNKRNQLKRYELEINELVSKEYGLNEYLKAEISDDLISVYDSFKSSPKDQILKHLFSVFIGIIFGRYSLNKEGLIIASKRGDFQDYLNAININKQDYSLLPDEDNIIPILDAEWFEDDIVGRFYEFLKVTFGDSNFNNNLAFIKELIGKDIRKYFINDFYSDHIKRYQKRPIYWMFSSPKGSFNVLIYMHRYTPDTVSNILNKYLKEFIGKLNTRKEHLERVKETGSALDKVKAIKESDNIQKMLVELHEYERDILYPLATERIEIDLDDGVLVNYNKFGKAVKEVKGLNDPATKKKVRQFDWIDTTQIR